MKKQTMRPARRFGSMDAAGQKLSLPFALSITGHVAVCILLLVGLPHFGSEHRVLPSAINVQLITADKTPKTESPAPAPKKKAHESKTAAKKPPPKSAVSTSRKKPAAVSTSPRKIEKLESMKARTYRANRVMENAIKTAEKRAKTSSPDQIQQALDRIRQKLKHEAPPKTAMDETGISGDRSGRGRPVSEAQLAYYAEIQVAIQKNWAYSDELAGGKTGLSNEVLITIMRDGTIKDILFTKRSGSSYFDDSTHMAILKSSPLPPIPKQITGPSLVLGIRFTPEGLK